MTKVIQKIVSVLENRRNEKIVKELIKSEPITSREESTMRRMAKRIAKGENQRGFIGDGECVFL